MGNDKKIRVGITHGDINGIGYEIILKTLSEPTICELCTPVLYGSSRIATFYRKMIDLENVPFNVINDANDIKSGYNNLIEVLDNDAKVEPGVESSAAGAAAFTSLERAIKDLKDGYIDVLVTAPINKHSIQSAEFNFPGHTEYLEASIGNGRKPLMILFNEFIKVALVTTHLPVSQISNAITKEAIIEKLTILNDTLKRDFGKEQPRIAVLSLNPHAGDNGLIGKEEQETIIPAIEEAYANKIICFGPYAADGFFGSGQYTHFDGVLAMYHDQGQIALKLVGFQRCITVAGGQPYPIATCAHGTAFDKVGKASVTTDSFERAVRTASRMALAKREKNG